MASKRTTMLIGLSPSRALALRAGPHVGTEDDDPERKSRRRWFRFDEVFNRLLVSVVACGLALFSVFGGPELEPQPASTSPGAGSSTDKYEIATAHRGDIFVRVTASGTVEPIRLVEISTELSGTIRAVHVDNNDEVKAGQLLAELDPATLRSEMRRAEAQVKASKARVDEAIAATVAASKDLSRKQQLASRKLTSARDLESANAAAQQAAAGVEALRAELQAAEANLAIARSNLKRGRIVSPIDGVVLRRNVEPGQTVAASLQTPVLFRLAQDLDRMQIRVDVDEADALSVREGQKATFMVQALRDQKLGAKVEKLYVGPEIVEGVVTYKALLSFDNSRLGLRPGMTATAEIVVEDRKDVLLVPNAALRFSPPDEKQPSESLLVSGTRLIGAGVSPAHADKIGTPAGRRKAAEATGKNRRRLWVLENDKAKPVEIIAGASDGRVTEVLGGQLAAGQRVIVDLAPEWEKRP